jgi:septal ring factor EnvC (AmiA/AmiB activator)
MTGRPVLWPRALAAAAVLAGALVFGHATVAAPEVSPADDSGKAAASGANAGEGRAQELQALEQAITARRERLGHFERHEQGLLETLEGIDRAAADLQRDVTRAEARARRARDALARAERIAAEAEARQAQTRRAMAVRAVALYKAGELGPVRAVFSSKGPRELLARVHALQTLLERDASLVARYRTEGERVAKARAAALSASSERDRAAARLAAGAQAFDDELASKRDLLTQLRADRERERAALDELEAAARALESTLDGLRAAPPAPVPSRLPSVPFATLRGRLPAPVDAPVARRFGRVVDAEFRTETFRKGVEFGATLGQPVRAVGDGEVRFAGWFRGYGKLVIVDHGDQYFTVAGHLDQIGVQVGDAVRVGDVIGSAGETGSLGGTLLYFEIRRGSEPLDPLEWMQDARTGE